MGYSVFGAGGENRTLIACLEGRHISHYTTPALLSNYSRNYVIIKSMGINKFANLPEDKPFHSSGYAEAAHGTNIGSTSTQSFADRHYIERNRSSVGKYRDSMVAGGPGQQEKESQVASSQQYGRDRLQVRSRPNRAGNAPQTIRPSFVEPPARKYNPYG
jgi:hypothetical protein